MTIVDGVAGITIQNDDRYANGAVTVNFTVASASITKLEYSLDGGAYVTLDPGNRLIELTGLADGEHTLSMYAEDSEDNVLLGETTFIVGTVAATSDSPLVDQAMDPMVLVGIGVVAVAAVGGVGYMAVRRRKK
jgi:hypothetical protein